ncbi:PucR family transcriptional regulator [Nonomuraea longispora]|uniref:PucR family transcriptional regulator n=1 Tax=Nonomuraea longispora TaxID=1848320 RepID=A0A4R4NC14_9ACTN|nr:PucR family transcriptional regulator [Nonomuraea longispora]TDC05794.1 PucR family transcriptional regulator [Nonomuraea longispora]
MFTLRSLAERSSLSLTVLVEGRPGAMDEPVAWVHNTELPDPSPYVREGELVLTNGLWLGHVSSAQFVRSVKGAGGSGIVFGLRAELSATPRGLVDACREEDVPLLEISIEVPFTAVSQAVADMLADERKQALVGMVRRGDALATAISRGAGAGGVLNVLRRDYDLPLAVVDRMARSLGTAGADLDADQLHAVATGLARHPPALEVELGEAGRAALFPVGAVGDIDAALICLRPLRRLTSAEREGLEQAARFLSLEVAKQQAVQAIEMRFASELLEMVLSGGSRAGEVPGRLRAFGVDPGGPLAVCSVAFAQHETATLHGLAEAIGEFFAAEGVPVVAAGGTQDVVAVLPWRHPEDGLPPMAQRLVREVERRFPGLRPVAGLGGIASHAAELRPALLQSREACRVLARTRTGPRVRAFSRLGTHRLLLGLLDAQTSRRFSAGLLDPLKDHDARRGGDLELTLRTFLDHDGQWAATAAALHVHVNTLRNRLAKVTELTGRDVGRTEDRVDLFLALTIDAID